MGTAMPRRQSKTIIVNRVTLKHLQDIHGLSNRELADRAHISERRLDDALQGRPVTADTVQALAEAFKVRETTLTEKPSVTVQQQIDANQVTVTLNVAIPYERFM